MNTEELVVRLKSNGTFRKNLARHFGLPEERVVAFVKEALVPSTLPRPTTLMNYGVTRSGKIYGKKTLLKKGTPVWATRSGKPILKWDCSNPLLPTLPVLLDRPKASRMDSTVVPGLRTTLAQELPPPVVEGSPTTLLAMESPMIPRESTAVPALPILSSLGESAGLPALPRDSLDLRIPLVGLVAVSELANRPSKPLMVPEPGTVSLCLVGLLGMGAFLARRSQNAA